MQLSAALPAVLISLAAATALPTVNDLSPRGLPGQPNVAKGEGAPNIGRVFPKGPMNIPNAYGALSFGNSLRWANPPTAIHWSDAHPPVREEGHRELVPPHLGRGGDQPPHLRGGHQ
ncbi:hypothetical protein L249_3410 [Ophiocordyceps polyrhachis-furcata BCC 54312]|uniref:Uncharacterized protein n=1 Tax=Ophiocordyceps polyrhachis-furcata BCC 54312 TaxID=1330021 RepID=A0A367LMI6_9HYPO|nr:hypothetical protein L249_3410 [Ophiocordyceps polyrhachis-furcata BCC 54312]